MSTTRPSLPKLSKLRKPKTTLKSAVKKKILTTSQAAQKARKGVDLGKKGKNFDTIASKAAQKYGSAAAGKRVAGAIFQQMRRKGRL